MALRLVIMLFAVGVQTVSAGEMNGKTADEISHLIEFIKASPCKFDRNGTWYEAADAADHIVRKYRYVLNKGFVDSADDFIFYAATKSSVSGERYMVQCAGAGPISSSDWLKSELASYRSAAK